MVRRAAVVFRIVFHPLALHALMAWKKEDRLQCIEDIARYGVSAVKRLLMHHTAQMMSRSVYVRLS